MRLTPRRVLVAALIAWSTCVLLGLVFGAPLTGDESAYGLLARGSDIDWLYRPRGVVALARIGILFGGSDLAMRATNAALSVTIIFAIAAVGRRLGDWVGVGAAALLAGTHTFVMRAPELLGDIPATACLLAAIAIAIGELNRADGPSYRFVVTAPLLAAAFYFRYGSAPVIAIIGIAAAVVWWRSFVRRPGPIVVTVVLFVALLVPFAIASLRATGSITGVLHMSAEVAGRRYVGEGLVKYFARIPFRAYGVLASPVIAIGLTAVFRPRNRVVRFLAIIAIVQLVAIGLVSHASPRFIFLALGLLVLLGVDVIARAIAASRHRVLATRIAVGAVVASWLAMAIAIVPIERHLGRDLAALVASARAIRDDAANRQCVVAAFATPQLMWYSGCAAFKLAPADTALALPADRRWYAASAPRRPVDPDVLARLTHTDAIALSAPGAWYLRPRISIP